MLLNQYHLQLPPRHHRLQFDTAQLSVQPIFRRYHLRPDQYLDHSSSQLPLCQIPLSFSSPVPVSSPTDGFLLTCES